MTVIAYRNGVMAGDSLWTGDKGMVLNKKGKVTKFDTGALYGASGACDDRELMARLAGVEYEWQLPSCKELVDMDADNVVALFVLPDGSMWFVATGEEEGGVVAVQGDYAAVGCGAPIALGAMWHNASALMAVRAAIEHNAYCRGPITFEERTLKTQ